MKKAQWKTMSLAGLLSVGLAPVARAQEVGGPEMFSAAWWSAYQTHLLLVAVGAMMLVLLLALLLVYRLLVRMLKQLMVEQGKASEWVSPIGSLMARLTQAVPVEHEQEIALHEYDGIVELDNKLPPWWVAMFYVTIVFSIGYMVYYHVLDGPTQEEEYRAEMKAAEEEVNAYLASLEEVIDESNVYVLQDEARLVEAQAFFERNCGACHGKQGEGLVGLGPNLTDDYWLHGGDIKSMFETVKYGVKATSMIAWGKQLTPSEMHAIVSYAYMLHGTNPPTEREPEGEYFERNPVEDYGEGKVPGMELPAEEEADGEESPEEEDTEAEDEVQDAEARLPVSDALALTEKQ